jgi:cellobiose phosphorylase
MAYSKLADGENAFDTYRRNCPSYLEAVSEVHKTEPYVYSQTIAGRDAQNFGEAKNSWLTGTAAWTFVAATQGILGITPTFDGLSILPCLPKGISTYHAKRMYRGVLYDIQVENSGGKTTKMMVDGEEISGNIVPIKSGVDSVKVVISI